MARFCFWRLSISDFSTLETARLFIKDIRICCFIVRLSSSDSELLSLSSLEFLSTLCLLNFKYFYSWLFIMLLSNEYDCRSFSRIIVISVSSPNLSSTSASFFLWRRPKQQLGINGSIRSINVEILSFLNCFFRFLWDRLSRVGDKPYSLSKILPTGAFLG